MSGIETKSPGFFTRGIREHISSRKGFDSDRMIFSDEDVSYALGKEGLTRKKLESTSGAILQYVGHVAYICGTLAERTRCREYLKWLLAQRRGPVTVADISSRTDCAEFYLPANCKGWVTGSRGSELRRMEQKSGTYMFMALDKRGEERLLIFSVLKGSRDTEGGRCHGERLVQSAVQEALQQNERRQRGQGVRARASSLSRSRSRSPSSRSRSRSRGKARRMRAWDD
eukprot:TRINITY_DN28182_c0_g2_i2.p1 TRINITY_DN28182_c0_g2~~TRINITY_DN28182_c0_g2_i2.p1  ORF type:complete len:228 (+),score=50.20 TRINITY_DN28182_c0_g2_i2:711-1394(+)